MGALAEEAHRYTLSERKATATRKMGTLECLLELPVCTRGEPWPQQYPGSRRLSEARMQAPGRDRQQAPGVAGLLPDLSLLAGSHVWP